jgi:phosphoribosylformimino-5-aminoimidazole carboxamide ribotide isomerase
MGSETLLDLTLINKKQQGRLPGILSLDYKSGEFLGSLEILNKSSDWPQDVIVMNLDHVGAAIGPDYSLLRQVKLFAGNGNVIAAGGVRNQQDIEKLSHRDVSAVLIATALHSGAIRKSDLQSIRK